PRTGIHKTEVSEMNINWKRGFTGTALVIFLVLGWVTLACSGDKEYTEAQPSQSTQLKGHLVYYAMPG
ncbi:MAG: hypothetical protein D6681_16360, partial [Calditrichaeota bacterium]